MNEKSLEEMTVKELKQRYISLYESIHVVECFNTYDLLELEAIEQELNRRGYHVAEGYPRILKKNKQTISL